MRVRAARVFQRAVRDKGRKARDSVAMLIFTLYNIQALCVEEIEEHRPQNRADRAESFTGQPRLTPAFVGFS